MIEERITAPGRKVTGDPWSRLSAHAGVCEVQLEQALRTLTRRNFDDTTRKQLQKELINEATQWMNERPAR